MIKTLAPAEDWELSQTAFIHADVVWAAARSIEGYTGQTDKSGQPYEYHLETVARLVSGVPSTQARYVPSGRIGWVAGAVFHDLVEDTELNVRHVREWSHSLAEVVYVLTKGKHESYDDYIGRVADHPRARFIKLADLQHNLVASRMDPSTYRLEDRDRTMKYMNRARLLAARIKRADDYFEYQLPFSHPQTT